MPVLPPEDYLPSPGAPSMPWKRWIVPYKRYLYMRDMEDKRRHTGDLAAYQEFTNEDKNTMLYCSLGKE